MFRSGTISHSVWRGFMSFCAFAVPMLVLGMPADWQSLSVGGVLMMLAHYAEKQLTA